MPKRRGLSTGILVVVMVVGLLGGFLVGRLGLDLGCGSTALAQPATPRPDDDWRPGPLADVADRVGVSPDEQGRVVLADVLDGILDKLEAAEGPPLAACCFVDITSVTYDSATDTLTLEARTLPSVDCRIEAQTGYFTGDIVEDTVRSDAVGRVTWSTSGITLRVSDRGWVEVTAKYHSTYECSDTETYVMYEIETP